MKLKDIHSRDKWMHMQEVMCAYLSIDGCSTVNDRIYYRALSSFTYFHFFLQTMCMCVYIYIFKMFDQLNVCVVACDSVHLTAECVCQSVSLQEREAFFFKEHPQN